MIQRIKSLQLLYAGLALAFLLASSHGQTSGSSSEAKRQSTIEPSSTETIHVDSRLVAVYALVKDRKGVPLRGLNKDDFIVKQDGKEQQIQYFSMAENLPLSIALLIDSSQSDRPLLPEEKAAGKDFLDGMLKKEDDQAMVVQFDSRLLQRVSLTHSVDALHVAVDGVEIDEKYAGQTRMRDAIYSVCKNVLATRTGRKAIILLTDGVDNGSYMTDTQVTEEAQRADVQVYAIQYTDWMPPSLTPSNHLNSWMDMTGDPGMSALRSLAESTGGEVFHVTRSMSLAQIHQQIAEDLRAQYELSYHPPPGTELRRFHKLEVKVKIKGMHVEARKGFTFQP